MTKLRYVTANIPVFYEDDKNWAYEFWGLVPEGTEFQSVTVEYDPSINLIRSHRVNWDKEYSIGKELAIE